VLYLAVDLDLCSGRVIGWTPSLGYCVTKTRQVQKGTGSKSFRTGLEG